MPLTERETKEHARLRKLWVTQRATRKQMLRCMELDSKARMPWCQSWPNCSCVLRGRKVDCPMYAENV